MRMIRYSLNLLLLIALMTSTIAFFLILKNTPKYEVDLYMGVLQYAPF
jgi:hypothetical protein